MQEVSVCNYWNGIYILCLQRAVPQPLAVLCLLLLAFIDPRHQDKFEEFSNFLYPLDSSNTPGWLHNLFLCIGTF